MLTSAAQATERLPRLEDLTQDEFWDLARMVKPGLTREEFDQDWAEFRRWKARRALH